VKAQTLQQKSQQVETMQWKKLQLVKVQTLHRNHK
jgi:hypothetical protein